MRETLSRTHIYLVALNLVGIVGVAYITHLFRFDVFFYLTSMVLVVLLNYLLIEKILVKIKKHIASQKFFASSVEHELRDSISSIYMGSESVLSDLESGNITNVSKEKSDELIKILEQDLKELKNVANIIKNLSLMASYQYSGDQIELSRVSLNLLLERLCNSVSKQLANDKNINIIFKDKNPAYIMGNESALKQMITNLLKNAVLYTPKGGTVTVSVNNTGNRVIMSVEDNGVGIDKKDLSHILNPFFRSSAAEKTNNKKGSGLGLAIVSEIAKQHRAKVAIKSAVNEGTAVSVSFPAVAHN